MNDHPRTFFAVVIGRSGYALDAYPEERERYRRELGRGAVGEFTSRREATNAVIAELRRRQGRPGAPD